MARPGLLTSELDDAALGLVAAELATAPAADVVAWAVDAFGERLCLATSMTDAVLVDVATRVAPGVEVVFVDTGLHFPETLETLELVRRRYDLNLRVVRVPEPPVPFHVADPVACCSAAKVAALNTALADKLAWMSGVRRADGPDRAATPVAGRDHRGLVKLNPLAAWSDDDVASYIATHGVPVNPLVARGYPSIGCAPCTRPVLDGGSTRSGRWDGIKTECGLHLPPPPTDPEITR